MLRPSCAVLAVEGGGAARQPVAAELRPALDVWCARSVEQALELLAERSFDAVVTDLALPDGDGLMVLVAASNLAPRSARILVWDRERDDARAKEGLGPLLHGALARPWPRGMLLAELLRLLPGTARVAAAQR
ncbi:MAG: response regulator [Myxococcaceae bacterium]|nr:response regulator [Myxococcaceae bacterium]MCI0670418.1 response regulator [Myxococcaceae bacterium]